mgnify:CR=1 FL=1
MNVQPRFFAPLARLKMPVYAVLGNHDQQAPGPDIDHALREALADTLLLAGHDYQAVGSAEEALEASSCEAFNLVVSDVNMPGMDGHQLLGLIRAR